MISKFVGIQYSSYASVRYLALALGIKSAWVLVTCGVCGVEIGQDQKVSCRSFIMLGQPFSESTHIALSWLLKDIDRLKKLQQSQYGDFSECPAPASFHFGDSSGFDVGQKRVRRE